MTAEATYKVTFIIHVDEARLVAEAGEPFRPTMSDIRFWTVGDLFEGIDSEIVEVDMNDDLKAEQEQDHG